MNEGKPRYRSRVHHSRVARCCKGFSRVLSRNLLLVLLMAAMVVGAVFGVCLRLYVPAFQHPKLHPREMRYLFFPAEIFLRLMTFLAVPLLVSSLVSGIGYMDTKISGRVGVSVLCYYVGTTLIAVTEGFVFIYAMRPVFGAKSENQTRTQSVLTNFKEGNRVDMLLDMFRNIFPDNLFTATFRLYQTKVSTKEVNISDGNSSALVEKFQDGYIDSMNILGITFMAILFAVGLSSIGNKGKPLFTLFDIVFETVMKIIQVLIWTFPIGTVFMIASTVVQMEDPVRLLTSMAIFLVTVLAGLLSHTLITQPLLYFIFLRKNPYKHLLGCVKVLVTAFATNNSTVTVPVTMDCLKTMGYNKRLIRFMIPIGATVNMDGYALYESLAAIFIATMNGMSPNASQIIILGLTAVAISIGAPTMGSGVVTLVVLFKSIGLPLQDIALLVPFDWILGRCRTAVNVWGDCVGVAVVSRVAGITDTEITEDDGDEAENELFV